MSTVKDKKCVLTGTFTTLGKTHAAIEAELASLGARMGESLSRDTDLLIYGDMPGQDISEARLRSEPWSKLPEVEIRDEAWLMAILSGEDQVAEPLSGPLCDYISRLDDYVERLRQNRDLKVGYHRRMPASAAHLDRLAARWGVDRFGDELRNLYRQADGFLFFWLDTNHPEYRDRWVNMTGRYALDELIDEPGRDDPSSYWSQVRVTHMERFPYGLGGACWLLPSSEALKRKEGFLNFQHIEEPSEEIEVYGRTISREYLTGGIRVFDMGLQYYPVGFWMEEGVANPPVLVGDDYGACWTDNRLITLENYLESLLNRHFTSDVRKELVLGFHQEESSWQDVMAEQPLDDLLHQPRELVEDIEDGTFEVRVEEVGPCDQNQARGIMIHATSSYFWRGADALGIMPEGSMEDYETRRTTILNSDVVAVRNQIALATSDIKNMDIKRVRELSGAKGFYIKKRTKTAFKEAMFADLNEPLEQVVVSVTTTFDVQTLRAPKDPRADLLLYGGWSAQARDIATRELAKLSKIRAVTYARDNMRYCGANIIIEEEQLTFVFDFLVEEGHEIVEGQLFRASDVPRVFYQ